MAALCKEVNRVLRKWLLNADKAKNDRLVSVFRANMRCALLFMSPSFVARRRWTEPSQAQIIRCKGKKSQEFFFMHVELVAACLNSRTGFTHVGWLYCILHSESKATAPWMSSTEALNGIVVSAVSSPLWLVGSNCWCLCFAPSNISLQLFDLVDTVNMMSRKTGLPLKYGRMAAWFCLTKPESQTMQRYGWRSHFCSFLASW